MVSLESWASCLAQEEIDMADWLDRLARKQPKSSDQARERLKLVLINDRTDLTPAQLQQMKNDILVVISRYIEIDPQTVRISMDSEGREQRLVAEIPLKSSRRRSTSDLE
jgi:cell division topological specificity factor